MNKSINYLEYDKVDEKTREIMDRLFQSSRKNYWIKKRIFDVVMATAAAIVLLPLSLIICLIIIIDDPHGSPIFKQIRIGRHGREFTMYKFRTMVVNAESMKSELHEQNEADGPAFKIKKDPRITGFGRLLRKISIDELPQLLNVIKGDMSFVGPRPPLPEEVSKYSDFQKLRLFVTPGLTCYWQTANSRNDISFEEWIKMDIDYIENRSMFLDFKLIFKTIAVILREEGR